MHGRRLTAGCAIPVRQSGSCAKCSGIKRPVRGDNGESTCTSAGPKTLNDYCTITNPNTRLQFDNCGLYKIPHARMEAAYTQCFSFFCSSADCAGDASLYTASCRGGPTTPESILVPQGQGLRIRRTAPAPPAAIESATPGAQYKEDTSVYSGFPRPRNRAPTERSVKFLRVEGCRLAHLAPTLGTAYKDTSNAGVCHTVCNPSVSSTCANTQCSLYCTYWISVWILRVLKRNPRGLPQTCRHENNRLQSVKPESRTTGTLILVLDPPRRWDKLCGGT